MGLTPLEGLMKGARSCSSTTIIPASQRGIEPIKNRVLARSTGRESFCRRGLEYKEAEVSNTVHCRVDADERLTFELKNTYGQLNAFDWSN
jgi:hypothetical protein